jgi:esterase
MLNFITTGEPTEKPPLLIAHGLFGSARNWGVVAKRLSDQRQVVAVDMRNHGDSQWCADHSYADLADDLAEVIAYHGGKMDVLGHSMGGKAAMVLALSHPDAVNRLVVVDIAPTGYSHTQMPMIDAMRAVDLTGVERRSDVLAQLHRVEDETVRAFLVQSVDVKQRRWRLNLDTLADEMDKILGFPQLSQHFDGEALFLSGSESSYVTRDHRSSIKALFPSARFARIPGAGHWIHAEKPREFVAAVRVFLNR